MPFIQEPIQTSPLVSRQNLDQSFAKPFFIHEAVGATFRPELLGCETVRAAWFLLLARYFQADRLNIEAWKISMPQAKSIISKTLSVSMETPLRAIVQEAMNLSNFGICLIEDSIHSFPLAERHLSSLGTTSFRTALITTMQPVVNMSRVLAQLQACHIIVCHELQKVSIWVDPRLCSAAIDAGLPSRLLSQMELIAHQLVHCDCSSGTVRDLEYFSHADKLNAESNDPALKPSVSMLLHEVIASFADSRPNAPAICAWDADLSYWELNHLSTQLGSHLMDAGVRPGTLVPLLFDKSAYTHVAQLAVLKAGGAFTTLPSDMPLARIESIVAQLRPDTADRPIVGLCSPLLSNILDPLVARVIAVDEQSVAEIRKKPQVDNIRPQPHDAAYVIFTSGTTGVPKGVVVEHRNICSSCKYFGAEMMGLNQPGVRHSQFLSYAFDGSIHDIFYTLSNGGCLCVLSEDERMNDISGAMTRMGVTHAKFTPSIVDQLFPEDFPTVQKLFLGGEPLTQACVDRWEPHVEVWNNYGPAECTVQSSVISCADPNWTSGVIGHAGASRCFIVDPSNPHRRMPMGMIGEILIEGPNVSRGYLRNANQTDHSFLQGLTWAPLRRFYRTGDMAFTGSHGLLTCKGRDDDQVKINGQRIELGEVETQLQSVLPGASRGVVDAVNPSGRGKILIAFIQLDSPLKSQISFDQLKREVQDGLFNVLPPAFIPSRILQLDEIPMGPTGKTDRKALRKLAIDMFFNSSKIQQQAPHLTIQDPSVLLESADLKERDCLLRKMWAETLQLPTETFNSTSDFFLLGGNSLLAMRLASFARKVSWNLNVKDIFRYPVLSDMLLAISCLESTPKIALQTSSKLKSLVAKDWKIDTNAIEAIYPASAIQENFLALASTNRGAYIMQYTFCIPNEVNLERLEESWRRVVKTHQILRTRFYHTATGLSQVVLKEDFHWKTQKVESKDARQKIKSTLLLPNQALCQFHIYISDESSSRTLIWTVSHALTDGWTSARLFAEVFEVYSCDAAVPIAEPYTSFVQSLSVAPEGMEGFWKEELDHGPVLEYPILPYSQFRPDTNSRRSGQVSISLTSTSRYGVPLMIRAAWAITISEVTQQEDVLFGVNLSGRNECPDVVGPTVTTVPIRICVRQSFSVKHLLELMHIQSVRMMSYEQSGLRRIGDIENGLLRPYCKFQNSLVVQLPREKVAGSLDRTLKWMDPSNLDTVSAHGLVVNCLVKASTVDVWMNYDNRILGEDRVAELMSRFLTILSQILSDGKDKTIAEISPHSQFLMCKNHSAHKGRLVEYLGQSVDVAEIEDQMAASSWHHNIQSYVYPIRPDDKATYSVLAAFVATDDFKVFTQYVAEIQSQIGKYLPNHMIPALYIPVSTDEEPFEIPGDLERIAWNYASSSTPSLQVDSKLDCSSFALLSGLSPVEKILMECWMQVLGRTDITVSDNFFLLGGDSIKAMRLVAAARAANLQISVASALQNPIFQQMAAISDIIESETIQDVHPWSLVGGREGLLGVNEQVKQQCGYGINDLEDISPVTSYQDWTFSASLRSPGSSILQTRYQIAAEFDTSKFKRAWQQVCLSFPNLRTRFVQPEGWGLLQAICFNATSPRTIRFATLEDLQVYMKSVLPSMTQLGASMNEILLAQVGSKEQNERYLVWSIHHVIFDGVNMAHIRQALTEVYHGDKITHQPVALREYVGFLNGQQSSMQDAYWRRYLKGAEASIFPHYPSPDYIPRPQRTHSLALSLKRSEAQPITMATMIHAAWGIALASFTRTRDVTYRNLLSGRTAATHKVDRFVGPTITLVPVRIRIRERLHSTVRGFLSEIQAQLVEMMPHTGAGIDKISSLIPENPQLLDFHNLLVIQSASGPEAKSERDIPMYPIDSSMDLDGLHAFALQGFISPNGVTLHLRWDESVISDSLIRILLVRMSYLLHEMVEGNQSVTIGRLRKACFSL
ncbi:acetyl-CoA synthetase-like protein [Penicillium taxi]|uniref:acetyl-CoA synthetase-like protein n=1 Tax=Penicillium taxi TaxID=168475 RepID=UPI002544F579|nr:acetyl-CoA synthetase-like protein [Penicillium taxi]KAJ5888534.1 acetyl-CoA synthetase-like protein [Penicillium taxi]